MIDWSRVFKYSAIALVLLLFIILGGWYIYLKNQTGAIEEADTGRGVGIQETAPAGGLGSMFSNLVAGLRSTDESVAAPSPAAFGSQSSGGFRSFMTRFTEKGNEGISSFQSSVKNAFGGLVSEIIPKNAEPERPKPPRLWHAHASPVAGSSFVFGTSTLRFMERATGHLFDANVETGALRRISNTLIPKTYGAEFARDGSVIAWSVEDGVPIALSGIVATSSATSSPSNLAVSELGRDIVLVPHKDERKFLALVEERGGFALVEANWRGEDPARLATTTLGSWRLFWGERIVVAQAPATGIPGYAYEVTRSGNFIPLARAVRGLTMLPHPTEHALLIASDDGSLSMSVSTSSATRVVLPIQTIADKCVWAPDDTLTLYCAVPERVSSSNFLDEWYQGSLHTEDAWWKVDANTGETELLFSPHSEKNVSLDVVNPKIDDGGNYLAFMDTRDQSLWVLRIRD